MAVLFLRCRRGRFLLSTAVFCIAFWHSPFATELQPMRWEMTVSLLVVIGALWLQPPFVLLLGASSQETGRALGRLANASFPFRVVALLDRSRTGTQFSSFSWLTDDLRTVDEREWRWVVDNLIEVIPIIVLDARTTRPVVVEEARQLLRHDIRLKRSTFVIGADCLAPALVLNGVSSSFSGIRVINEGQIGNVLSFTTLSAPSSPTAPHEPS